MFEFFTKSLSATATTAKKICGDVEVQAAAANALDVAVTVAGLTALNATKQWLITEGREAIERAYFDDESGKAAAVKAIGDVAELAALIESAVTTSYGLDKMAQRCEKRTQGAREAKIAKLEPKSETSAITTDIGCSEAKRHSIEQALEDALAANE